MPTFAYCLLILEGKPGAWTVQSAQGANPGLATGREVPHWVDLLVDAGTRGWEYVEKQEQPNKILMLLKKTTD
jgi:hypothetical protein